MRLGHQKMSSKKYGLIETIFGGIVFFIACGFLVYAVKISSLNSQFSSGNFKLYADFNSAEGLKLGSDIVLAGVKVGAVSNIELDTQDFIAKTTFSLFENFNIPDDTEAIISSDGLLGEKYISLNVGGSDTLLEHGDEFIYTQSSVNILNLLGKFATK
jgi:phospholipid/cholesterol/gamma-HCH transport system substrate-binding protein